MSTKQVKTAIGAEKQDLESRGENTLIPKPCDPIEAYMVRRYLRDFEDDMSRMGVVLSWPTSWTASLLVRPQYPDWPPMPHTLP